MRKFFPLLGMLILYCSTSWAQIDINTQVGAAYEERNNYWNVFPFINQMIDKHFFWELRGYYIYNFITVAPPTRAIPEPTVHDERNLSGTGGVVILGYSFPLNCKVSLMPFFRYQYLTNTNFVYDDDLGNEIRSGTSTYYLGMKLSMDVTEQFSTYVNVYAGYARGILHGHGFFRSDGTPIINSITSTFELGIPYKVADRWTVSPYIQYVITGNNPNHAAFINPIHHPGLTTNTPVFAIRLAYKV